MSNDQQLLMNEQLTLPVSAASETPGSEAELETCRAAFEGILLGLATGNVPCGYRYELIFTPRSSSLALLSLRSPYGYSTERTPLAPERKKTEVSKQGNDARIAVNRTLGLGCLLCVARRKLGALASTGSTVHSTQRARFPQRIESLIIYHESFARWPPGVRCEM